MGHMSVVGLAKKKEELFYPGDQESLQLAMHGSSLLLLRRIRDEVHRFGITFHRKTRSRGTVKTALQDIKGIGEQTATALLTHFKSVRRIQEASIEELAAVVGRDKAQRLVSHYKR